MRINLQKYSFRFAEQVLNSKLVLKQEIENILLDPCIELHSLNRPHFNKILENLFIQKELKCGFLAIATNSLITLATAYTFSFAQ